MSRDWRLYLEDILAACRKVQRYTAGMSLDALQQDERTYDAVVRNLEIIGEAAKRVPESVRRAIPGTDWRKVTAFRDVLAHAYFGLDDGILWDVIQNKVPDLAREVRVFLESADDPTRTSSG